MSYPDEIISNYLCSETIDRWFILPRSPHFGGLLESGVKSVKHHLKRVIRNLELIYEVFLIINVQAKGFLNSKAISPLSSDPNDFGVLIPGNFFISRTIYCGASISSVSIKPTEKMENCREENTNDLKKMIYWLLNLQQRNKRFSKKM